MAGLVIAEVGGSSSRWAWVHPEGVSFFPLKGTTIPGFNPLSGSAELFREAVQRYFAEHAPGLFQADRMLVYAAGCGTPKRRQVMHAALAPLWPSCTQIEVDSDLLAAARGLCGKASGLVLILGTGMNAGWYDAGVLHRPMPSLGWILGDEGSGADIGRALLQDAFYRRMPEHVSLALFGAEGPDLEQVLEEVYLSPFPARAMAARTALLGPLRDEPYVRDLIIGRFHAMAELLVSFHEHGSDVFATGSVAWAFREWLNEVLLDRGLTLVTVERDPLPGLVHFHRPG